ncbi:MAG: hypothetical protein HY755_12275 [Nitrospirae bacterium]|nr:hypothetical protein [Nitrospirota bacterium]
MRKKYIYLILSILFLSFITIVPSVTTASDISLESNPLGIAINPNTDIAVVANEKANSVSIVDLNTQSVLSTVPVGKAPRGVAIDKELNLAVIGNSHDDTVSIIDLNNYQIITTLPVGKSPEGITVLNQVQDQSNHIALVTNQKDDTVSVIDLTTYKVIETIPVGQEPKDIAIDPDPESSSGRGLALVVNEKDYTASVIDLDTYQLIGEVPVGKKPQAIAINPETHLSAVVNEKDNSITLINLLDWQTVTLLVCKHPMDIAINSLDNRALIICDGDKDEHKDKHKHNHQNEGESLLLVDLNTNTVIKNYAINKKSRGVAVNNFTNIAAVVDDKTDSLTLIQLPNPVPEIISINPLMVYRGSSGESILIHGNKFIKTSTVYLGAQVLETIFIDNHNLQVIISKDLLTDAGTYQITITNPSATDKDGGTSNSINLQVNNPVPSIFMLDPQEAKAGTAELTLTVYGSGFYEDTEVFFGNAKKPITYISPTKLQIQLTQEDLKTAGQYEIKAYNLPPGGGDSNKFIFTAKPSLEIKITSPIDGETINKAKIIVKGTFNSDTKDIGIKVNGIIAEITGNEWIANNIPLAIGANTITATATDSYGNTDTKAITINTDDTSQPVTLSANITSGIAPLQVFFSTSTSTFTPVSYQMDFEGDGIIDYTGPTFADISHTYASEGIFYPTLSVTDSQGNIYSDTIAITVMNKTEIDTLLKGKWEGIKGALLNKNLEKGLSYFLESSRENYRQAFNIIIDELQQIISQMQDIEMIYQIDGIAKYRINRVQNIDGTLQTITYYIYLVKDANGIWRLDRF